MRRYQSSLISDGAFLLLFLACFASIVFVANDPNRYIQNIIFLNVAFLIAIVTYFTTVTTGLILNLLFIFGYGTFTTYETVVVGGTVSAQNYFWLVMTPIYTVAVWLLTMANKQLQTENEQLKRTNASLATVDESTNLKTTVSFQKDATVFMALSNRYHIPLTLLVLNAKYWDEVKRMISEQQMAAIVQDLSAVSQTSIRTNDSLYLLNRDVPTWGMLLFTDRDGAHIVINRLRQRVAELNSTEYAARYRVELNLRIGALQYDPATITNPLEFIVQAKRQLEYDV